MHIKRLTAENIKRISVVEITPDGNIVQITGKNGQGKTSVLDSIAYALGGGQELRGTAKPIREGEESGKVRLDMGSYTVTKYFDQGGPPRLVVMSSDGESKKSPQKFLDELLGDLSFDPLAFTRKSAKDQLADLLMIVDLPFDPLDLQAERDIHFGNRTDVNRRVTSLKGQLDGVLSTVKEIQESGITIPDSELSSLDILEQLAQAESIERENEAYRRRLAEAAANVDKARELVQRAERALAEAQEAQVAAEDKAAMLTVEVAGLPDVPNLDSFRQQLADAEQLNHLVRERDSALAQRDALASAVVEATTEAEVLTKAIESIDRSKADALAKAKMPVEGLMFDDQGTITFNNIPFGQCSAAEQLRVSLAMGMAMNPVIKVMLIRDGSLLDPDNLALIEAAAIDNDYQVWIEVVREGGVGFELVDGHLA